MNKVLKLLPILLTFVFLSSCKTLIKKENSQDNSNEIDNEINNENNNSEKKQMEIRFSCGEDGISEYLDNGWKIVDEYSEEKICTWKSFPASKNCNMEKDKGCKITRPDKIGEERIYKLEK